MFLLRGLLDRILLIGAIFAAACVPSFIAQYRQRLGGRLDQVLHDLAPFQEIANRNHGGDLRKLDSTPIRARAVLSGVCSCMIASDRAPISRARSGVAMNLRMQSASALG